MIDVRVVYKKVKYRKEEKFLYKRIEVIGHANDGTTNSVKCCAGVTAVLGGFATCIDDYFESVKLEKGYFLYKCSANYSQTFDTQIMLDCVIQQLYGIYKCYPNLFKNFELVEIKES